MLLPVFVLVDEGRIKCTLLGVATVSVLLVPPVTSLRFKADGTAVGVVFFVGTAPRWTNSMAGFAAVLVGCGKPKEPWLALPTEVADERVVVIMYRSSTVVVVSVGAIASTVTAAAVFIFAVGFDVRLVNDTMFVGRYPRTSYDPE